MTPAHIPEGTVNQDAVGVAMFVVLLVLSTACFLIARKIIWTNSLDVLPTEMLGNRSKTPNTVRQAVAADDCP